MKLLNLLLWQPRSHRQNAALAAGSLVFLLAVFVVLMLSRSGDAAADSDLRDASAKPWQVLTVTTSAATKVVFPDNDVQIVHLGIQNDGSTASASGDYIVVMREKTEAGAAVSMAANLNDGIKLPIFGPGSATIRATDVPAGTDGPHEIQIQAVGHGAKVLIIRGIRSK